MFDVNGPANKKERPKEYYDSYERIWGWRCYDCRINNKGKKCKQCKQLRKDCELG